LVVACRNGPGTTWHVLPDPPNYWVGYWIGLENASETKRNQTKRSTFCWQPASGVRVPASLLLWFASYRYSASKSVCFCVAQEDMTQQPNANGRSTGPGRDDDKKLFVGGLGRSISEKELREYFTQYGEIENINIKTDPMSGQSRGFAFVQFVNAKTVDDLLAAGDHFIANKKVDPKRVSCRTYLSSTRCCSGIVRGH